MPIIVKTRRGYQSYTEYDIEDAADYKRLVRRIRDIAKEAEKPSDAAYKNAILKFMAITLHQQNQPNHSKAKAIWTLLMKHIERPTPEELAADPETLFAPPESKSKGSPRKKNGYEENITPALRTLTALDELPAKEQLDDPQRLADVIEKHAEDIKEHARRRVELFFLLCVALYKTKRIVSLVETDKQHGQATPGFQYAACHSSFFPTIDDCSAARTTHSAAANTSILKGTHFSEVLNETVELPDCVNKFDSFCEGRNGDNAQGLRKQLHPVLQQVSDGDVSPLTAIMLFFVKMTTFFDSKKLQKNISRPTKTPEAVKQQIRTLEEEGTFYWADQEKQQPSVDAVSAWLRVARGAAAFFLDKPETVEACYSYTQGEILNSRPVISNRR